MDELVFSDHNLLDQLACTELDPEGTQVAAIFHLAECGAS